MKSVAAALEAALKKRVWRPAVEITVDDRRNAGVSPTVWSQWYAGTEVNVAHGALASAGGWIIDFRVNTTAEELYCRRMTLGDNPALAAWTRLASGVRTDAQIAAAVDGDSVYIFWVDSDLKTIKYKVSTNAAGNWSAVETAGALADGHKCNSLAAVCPGEGLHDVLLFVADSPTDDQTTQDKDIRWAYYTVAGGWSALASWGRTLGKSCRGIAAVAHDCNGSHSECTLVVTGKFETVTSGFNLQAYHLHVNALHSGTFTHVGCEYQGSSGSVGPHYPSMIAETENDRARVLIQWYDGSLAVDKRWQAYWFYIHELLSGEDLTFGPRQTFRITNHAYTLGCCRLNNTIIAGSSKSLWNSRIYDGGDAWRVNVTKDLIAFEHHVFDNALIEDVDVQPGYGYVFLDNRDGRYADYGLSGATHEAIKRGAQVIIKAGYKTPSGEQLEILPPMWIDRVIQVCNPRSNAAKDVPHLAVPGGPLLGGSSIVLSLYDVWAMTTKRGPTADYSSNAAPRDILRAVFGNMGLKYADDGTARLGLGSGGYPRVTWTTLAGRAWYLMLRDMLRYVHCRVKFYTVYDEADGWPTARAYVFADRDVSPADLQIGGDGEMVLYAGLYTEQDRFGGYLWEWKAPPYSPSTATLLAGGYSGAALEGDGVSELEIDFDAVEAMGYWQPRQVIDFQITAETYITAEERVAFAAGEVQPLYGGQVLMPLHPCLEIWDRLWIHDARACDVEQRRFVVGIESYYDTRSGRCQFDQVVHLLRHVR